MGRLASSQSAIRNPQSEMDSFVHLHCHTHYSLLDGANRIPELVAQTKALGMNACAITDHGNLYGAVEFYGECQAAGINPIIGYEAYLAPPRPHPRHASPPARTRPAWRLPPPPLPPPILGGVSQTCHSGRGWVAGGVFPKPRNCLGGARGATRGPFFVGGAPGREIPRWVFEGQPEK